MAAATYPVRVEGQLDPRLSRWVWLVKWLLAIPHFIVLFFLWVAFIVVSIGAFFAILFTGRYPRGMFEFNVGVLRWTWRVEYYTYGALGTDRYPPFSLAEVPDYPAHFDVAYPEQLSRGLVLIKWWLLAIPHYLVAGIFIGGGTWAFFRVGDSTGGWSPGLIGLLVLIAAVVLLFTGRYPQTVFDFVLGMNRWVLRVAAYAGLLTDKYPPFRLDMGGSDPSGTMTLPAAGPDGEAPATAEAPGAPVAPPPSSRRRGWTAWRVTAVVMGALVMLLSLGLLVGGGVATWADNAKRDGGYVTSSQHTFATSSYAVTSNTIDLGNETNSAPGDWLGRVRIRATAVAPNTPVFIGIGRKAAVDAYLGGVSHRVVTSWWYAHSRLQTVGSLGPSVPPTQATFWAASASGVGQQTITWKPKGGDWAIVVMNPNGQPGLAVKGDIGAKIPWLGELGIGALIVGGLLLAGATALIVVPIVRASR